MNENKKLSLYCILYSTASQWANDYWNFVFFGSDTCGFLPPLPHTQNTFLRILLQCVCVNYGNGECLTHSHRPIFDNFFYKKRKNSFSLWLRTNFVSVSKIPIFFVLFSCFSVVYCWNKSNWRALSFFFKKKMEKNCKFAFCVSVSCVLPVCRWLCFFIEKKIKIW